MIRALEMDAVLLTASWISGLPIAHHVSESIENVCYMQTQTSNQHIELSDSRVNCYKKDRQIFVNWLKQHSPFVTSNNLISLSSGIVGTDNINCHKAREIGKTSMDKLINEGDTFGTFKLKRNNMVKPLVFINWSSKTKDANMSRFISIIPKNSLHCAHIV